jgi:hypothetical protein
MYSFCSFSIDNFLFLTNCPTFSESLRRPCNCSRSTTNRSSRSMMPSFSRCTSSRSSCSYSWMLSRSAASRLSSLYLSNSRALTLFLSMTLRAFCISFFSYDAFFSISFFLLKVAMRLPKSASIVSLSLDKLCFSIFKALSSSTRDFSLVRRTYWSRSSYLLCSASKKLFNSSKFIPSIKSTFY